MIMKDCRFFKFSNSMIIVDFDNEASEFLNKEYHRGLNTIHVMIYHPERIKVKSLIAISDYFRKENYSNYYKGTKVKMILHCSNELTRQAVIKLLKKNNVKRNDYFYIANKTFHDADFYFRENNIDFGFTQTSYYVISKSLKIKVLNR